MNRTRWDRTRHTVIATRVVIRSTPLLAADDLMVDLPHTPKGDAAAPVP